MRALAADLVKGCSPSVLRLLVIANHLKTRDAFAKKVFSLSTVLQYLLP